jgi:hypothetical protein|tara:strand:+ start:241 stop:522 length:282 start_codon:yes stop_codon:yes gene_type:complete
MTQIEVFSPIAQSRVLSRELASRSGDLASKRVALLDNLKANAGALLEGVAAKMQTANPGVEVCRFEKEATAAASDVVMAHLKTFDAVVLAIAD